MKRYSKTKTSRKSRAAIMPAILAVGGGLTVGPAHALELGDIQVQSTLGQPLRASIAFALGPNEALQNYCVSVSAASSSNGLPTVGNTRIDIADGVILLTGRTPIREPIVSTQLRISCPYTPNITRDYMMFIDPSDIADARSAPAPGSAPPAAAAQRSTRPAAASRPSPRAPREPVYQGSDYRVQFGETLSQIAERIENRQLGLWPAVNALFEANPGAFADNDPNKLKAGSLLVIPEFVGNEVADFAAGEAPAATSAPAASVQAAQPTAVETPPSFSAESVDAESTRAEAPVAIEPVSGAIEETPESMVVQAGPVEAEAQVDAGSAERVVIPDTRLDSPPQAASSPNRSVARIQEAPPAESGNLLLAALGGGVALIALLLLFGRQFRNRFTSTPVGAVAATGADYDDHDTIEATATGMGFIADDSPTDRNLALDAKLDFGHDLDGGVDVDFSEEFGASGTTRLDVELPPNGGDDIDADTDIIPPGRVESSSILESEILPDDDDYDMSVIMDVTKMPSPDDVTEKDLKAIEVDTLGQDSGDGEYTLEKAVDYTILEKDYQDELSATQALNLEIEKAARELSERLERDEAETTSVQIADVSEMDVTAELSAQNDELLTDLDDTNINEALQLPDDETAILDQNGQTSELPLEDKTVEMQRRSSADADDESLDVMTSDGDHTVEIITRDDDTVEMEIEGGRVDTHRRKG